MCMCVLLLLLLLLLLLFLFVLFLCVCVCVCGGGVPVSGQSGVSLKVALGDTLFLSGQNGHGPDTDKQVRLGLHLTAAGGIHGPIPRGCSCACVSYACVRADSSGNSVQMGSTVTKCNAVTKKC